MLWLCRASKLYMYGACVADRDNDFGNALPDCDSNGAVTDFTEATCNYVFAHGEYGLDCGCTRF